MMSSFSMLGGFTVCASGIMSLSCQCPCCSSDSAAIYRTDSSAILNMSLRNLPPCDKKAYLWFVAQSFGTVAMTLCCEDKNDATPSSPAKIPSSKTPCIKGAGAKLPFQEGMAISTTDRVFREEATKKRLLERLLFPANCFLKLQN